MNKENIKQNKQNENKCRYCKQSIPHKASVCYQCGLPQHRWLKCLVPIKWLEPIGLLASIVLLIVSIYASIDSIRKNNLANRTLQENKNLTETVAKIYVENVLSRGTLDRRASPEEIEIERNNLLEMLSRVNIDKEITNKTLKPLTTAITNRLTSELENKSREILRKKTLENNENIKILIEIISNYNETSSKSEFINSLKEINAYNADLDYYINRLDNFIRKDTLQE